MPGDPNALLETINTEVITMLQKGDVSSLVAYLSRVKSREAKDAALTPPTIADSIVTIIENIPSNKYLFSIVITACLKKIVDPKQDIRIGQDNMENGYSNRSLDQRIVTPFLKRHDYTHCEASGLESGRNFERPLPWNLDYPSNPRGRGNRESFLAILDFVESGGDARIILQYMLYLDATRRETRQIVSHAPIEKSIQKIIRVFERHFNESSGQGKSRLPVLAVYGVYQLLIQELARYKECTLLPLERRTTADLRSGSIGDIQVNVDGHAFEGVEIKSDKPVTADMVTELVRKFNGTEISRYYILTTFEGIYKEEDKESVLAAVEKIQAATGCQIIVGELEETLLYALRLVSDPGAALENYSVLLNSDPDIRPQLIKAWNSIVADA